MNRKYIRIFLTKDVNYKKINDYPFIILNPFENSNKKTFTLSQIKLILENDNINVSKIDQFKYYSNEKGGYINIKSNNEYPLDNCLTLYLHLKKITDCEILEMEKKICCLEQQLQIQKNIFPSTPKTNLDFSRQSSNCEYDLIFLYSSPIVKQIKSNESNPKYNEFNEQINYRKEIQGIVNTIKNSKKQFNALFECASDDNLINSIRKYPKILHISAHGIIYKEKDEEMFKLCLENNGCADFIKEDRIKSVLNDAISKINLVFIGACDSEKLGYLFYKSGVKNVICVREMTKISDKGARNFSKKFYELLLKGDSVKEAFNKSKESFNDKSFNDVIMECCCNHRHKEHCKYNSKSNKEKVQFHNTFHVKEPNKNIIKNKSNIKKCMCFYSEYHIHDKKCKILENPDIHLLEKEEICGGSKVKICCCSPNIPHNESNKFKLFTNENEKNKNENKIFEKLNNGNFIVNNNCCTECDVFNIMKKKIKFIGRGEQTKTIMDMISKKGKRNKFFLIYGPKNSGKKTFAKNCSFYLRERNKIEKIEFINLDSIFYCYSKQNIQNLIKQISTKRQDGSEISKNKIFIIISFPSNIEEESLFKCVKSVLEILYNYNEFIYLLLIDTESDENKFSNIFSNKEYCLIQMTPLSKECSTILFKKIVLKNPNYEFYTQEEINQLLEITNCYPRGIIDLYFSINGAKKFEDLKENLSNTTKILENLKMEIISFFVNNSQISKLLFLLSILPKGLSKFQIDLIMEKNYENELNNNNVINKIYKEKQQEYWYKIKEFLITQVIKCTSQKSKKKWIIEAVKLFSKLFRIIIENNQEKKNNDDITNYEFNAINNEGIWKTFNKKYFDKCFSNLPTDKKINIQFLKKHRYNLECLFLNYQELIMNILEEKNLEFKEYLEQILLCLPSLYKLDNRKEECISLLYQYREVSQNFNLKNSQDRLNLFLYSLEYDSSFNPSNYFFSQNYIDNEIYKEGQAESYFLKGIKLIQIKEAPKEIIKNLNDSNHFFQKLKNYNKISMINFILGEYHNKELSKYEESIQYYEKAINYSAKNNETIFIKSNLEIAKVFEKLEKFDKAYNYAKNAYNKLEKENNTLSLEVNNYLIVLKQKKQYPIVMLTANPFFNINGDEIPAYINNEYLILKKLEDKIKNNIRFKHLVLNKKNFEETLNLKGELLIIKSDDYYNLSDVIVFENEKGQSYLYSMEEMMKNNFKCDFQIVILGFINSEKIKDYFLKIGANNIIFFKNLDEENPINVLNYNNFIGCFISNFIEKIINKPFKIAFDETLNSSDLIKKSSSLFKNSVSYYLSNNANENKEIFNIYKQKNGKIHFNYPIIPKKLEINKSNFKEILYKKIDIFQIIELIYNNQIINIYGNSNNLKYSVINAVAYFFHRQNIFEIKIEKQVKSIQEISKFIDNSQQKKNLLIIIFVDKQLLYNSKGNLKKCFIGKDTIHGVFVSKKKLINEKICYEIKNYQYKEEESEKYEKKSIKSNKSKKSKKLTKKKSSKKNNGNLIVGFFNDFINRTFSNNGMNIINKKDSNNNKGNFDNSEIKLINKKHSEKYIVIDKLNNNEFRENYYEMKSLDEISYIRTNSEQHDLSNTFTFEDKKENEEENKKENEEENEEENEKENEKEKEKDDFSLFNASFDS